MSSHSWMSIRACSWWAERYLWGRGVQPRPVDYCRDCLLGSCRQHCPGWTRKCQRHPRERQCAEVSHHFGCHVSNTYIETVHFILDLRNEYGHFQYGEWIILYSVWQHDVSPYRLFRSKTICDSWNCWLASDMSNSIETAIAIAIFGTIAIGIAIAKAIFQLLLLLLILLREFSNYCYCYWYC